MRRLIGLVLIGAALAAPTSAENEQMSPSLDGWSGTARIVREGSGPVGAQGRGFHREVLNLTLRPDGTASYQAQYEWRVEVPVYPPLRSSGQSSGETYWGLGFVDIGGGAWEVGASEGGVRARLDTTSVAQVLYDVIASPVLGPQQVPPVIEEEWRQIAGFADVVRQPSTARTLSGAVTSTVPFAAMQNLVPLTETVTWSIARTSVDPEPVVTIRGPSCACIDADDPAPAPIVITAGATRRGGEFSEFTITPDGAMPEILTNDGGAQPRLELNASSATGAVTIRIRYTYRDRVYQSAPFRLEFCVMKGIELSDPSGDYAFHSTRGTAKIDARQEAWLNGAAASDQVQWSLEQMPSPTTLTLEPESGRGSAMAFTYTGLPVRNDAFGPRRLTSSVRAGSCDCSQQRTIRTFFDADATNNPEGKEPNWYFYWRQTDAVAPPVRSGSVRMEFRGFLPLDPGAPGGTVAARWDGASETLFVTGEASQLCAMPSEEAPPHAPSGRQMAEGIDCFAELLLHELQHRQDFIEWWGSPKGPFALSRLEWLARDHDLDLVPNVVEEGLPGCRSGLPTDENKYSCDARPFTGVPDAEIRAYYAGWRWPLGRVNHQDWSCGGVSPKQWKGSTCR
ncbi:MAG: hypothetical protein AMXMBFR57_23200 [Acidimicrobiia bacterium]